VTDGLLGGPATQRRLGALRARGLNYDPEQLGDRDPSQEWSVTDVCQPLAPEVPGDPEPGGTWEAAQRLMRGYEFADPSIVRAYYDRNEPLEGRTMLLELKALGVLRLYVGVRVSDVYDRTATMHEQPVRIWGWSYRTLEGHVEQGQMDWEVWKWTGTGEVEFRVHSISRPAPISNPLIRAGFRVLRGHERDAFLRSTQRRMLEFTRIAREQDDPSARIREAAQELTARPSAGDDAAIDELAAKSPRTSRRARDS
jgi:uncharacterized protein (UPF0548 family)